MPALITTDLHLDDDPINEYRFDLFPWLAERAEAHKASHVFILGDLTTAKDRHSAKLVNRIAREIATLAKVTRVMLLRGNHDAIDPKEPFFRFLRQMPNVDYFRKATLRGVPDLGKNGTAYDCWFLPHSRHPQKDFGDLDLNLADFVFMHQTVDGAASENGMALSGVPRGMFKAPRMVFSGDVHVPQQVGNVTYVGSPYHVHFGDNFKPQVLLLERLGVTHALRFPAPSKVHLRVAGLKQLRSNSDAASGDHVKVTITLPRQDFDQWREIRQAIMELMEKRKWVNCGLRVEQPKSEMTKEAIARRSECRSPSRVVADFCKAEKLDEVYSRVGQWIVSGKQQ